MSDLQRQVVKEGRASDDVEFWGAMGRQGFKTYLEKKFGSLVAGWRQLDKGKNGRLSFYEFCNACRAMGYHGNLKQLWAQLDSDNSGMVSLMEIDEEVGTYVGTFKLALLKRHGDMLTAWRKGVDTNGNGRVEENEICDAVRALGLTLDGKKLFKMLCAGGLGITLMEFDPDSWNRWVTGDLQGLCFSGNKEFLENLPELEEDSETLSKDVIKHHQTGAAREFRRMLMVKEREETKAAQFEVVKNKVGLHTAAGFKAALLNRCGSLLGAWREYLDLNCNGRLTFGEFCHALSRLAFHGDVKGLWKQLIKPPSVHLHFFDLDEQTDIALTELRTKLEQQYGNMLMAWLRAFDVKGTGCVNEQSFMVACHKVGYQNDASELFKVMQPDQGRTFLTLRDFDTKAYSAMRRGDFRMMTESEHRGKRPLDMTFMERQQAGFFYQIRKSWDTAKRDEFAKACRVANVPDRLIDTKEEFVDLCIRKFGTIMGAWRNCLDRDGNGKLTFNEWCEALRQIGYAGDINALWKTYDVDKKGHIAIKDMDPMAHEVTTSFMNLLSERFGTLDKAWTQGFGKDPHDSLTAQELAKGCETLGFSYSAKELFKYLQPLPGRQLITIWDFDPACARKRQRGQASFISEPRSFDREANHRRHQFGSNDSLDTTSVSSFGKASVTSSTMLGGGPLQQLRQALKLKYGSSVAAWRNVMDSSMTGSLSFGKLVIVLEDCCFSGHTKRLWEDLSMGKSTISFKDVDGEAARMLDNFREQLISCRGSITAAWTGGLDIDGLGRVDEADFLRGILKLGVTSRKPQKLFRSLLGRLGQRSLTIEDLQALLIGVAPDQRMEAWSGTPGMGSMMWEITPDSQEPPSPKLQAQEADLARHHKDVVINTLAGFKRALVTKYGSLFGAWRKGLDADQNGVVTNSDFASACRNLGVKAIHTLWAEIDANANGQISLNELDLETAEYFSWLECTLIERYGSAREGWKKVFDAENSLRCDQEKFVKQCKFLGFEGDAERFFRLLRPEPGRPYLSYQDLWLNLDPNYNLPIGSEPSRSPLGGKSKTSSNLEERNTAPSSPVTLKKS